MAAGNREIRVGHHTAMQVQRLGLRVWDWRVWRVNDGAIVMIGQSRTRRQALMAADAWRRLDARRYGRDPHDV